MRRRSRRKCAPMNAGDLGSRWAVCACAYDPIHVTAQDKRLGPNCACVPFVTRFYAVRSLKLCEQCGSNTCVCVFFFPWGHVNIHAQIWGFVTSMSHVCLMLDSDWLKKFLLRCDWLGPIVACITTIGEIRQNFTKASASVGLILATALVSVRKF